MFALNLRGPSKLMHSSAPARLVAVTVTASAPDKGFPHVAADHFGGGSTNRIETNDTHTQTQWRIVWMLRMSIPNSPQVVPNSTDPVATPHRPQIGPGSTLDRPGLSPDRPQSASRRSQTDSSHGFWRHSGASRPHAPQARRTPSPDADLANARCLVTWASHTQRGRRPSEPKGQGQAPATPADPPPNAAAKFAGIMTCMSQLCANALCPHHVRHAFLWGRAFGREGLPRPHSGSAPCLRASPEGTARASGA